MIDPKALELLPHLLESMNDSILVDKDGKILLFSESYAKDAGVKAEDVIGKNVKDVITNTRMHIILETGKEESAELFASVVSTNPDTGIENSTPVHFCNRIPVRKNGDPNGEIIGAFAYTSLGSESDFEKMQNELKKLQQQDQLMSAHLSEVYKPTFLLDSIKGSSEAVNQMRDVISKVAASNITVTIVGETGTGKELVAGAIHDLSPRRNKPFIKINCAAIPENLLESELFGYEPGAFTGASRNGKIGKFELANNGTILLDEIGEMPLSLQTKLLRVLQEKELERIGGKKTIPLNIRIICSTNRNLKKMVDLGLFREDLYYRINVMEIKSPALRDRLDDLEELCEYFVKKYSNTGYGTVTEIHPSVYDMLRTYSWPGNVRELEHVLECACVMAGKGTLKPEHFDFLLKRMAEDSHSLTNHAAGTITDVPMYPPFPDNTSERLDYNGSSLSEITQMNEIKLIKESLERNRYNISAVAKELNTNRSSLYRKMKKHKIYPYDK